MAVISERCCQAFRFCIANLALALSAACIPNFAFASEQAFETFAEVATMYIGSCEALISLKKTSCTRFTVLKEPEACFDDTVKLLPANTRTEFRKSINFHYQQIAETAAKSAKIGLNTVVNGVGGDIQRGCEIYVATLNTYSHSRFEELTRLSKMLPKR